MGWIEDEWIRLLCPRLADELVGCEPFESLQASAEVVGRDEVGEVAAQLLVGFVIEALDGSLFDGPVHALDLAIGPGVLRLGQTVIDVVLGTGQLEGVSPLSITSVSAASWLWCGCDRYPRPRDRARIHG